MNKKVTSLKVDTLRGDSYTFYPMKRTDLDKTYMKQVFSDEEITQMEIHFDQFYKLVSDHCIDKKAGPKTLKQFENELKNKFFLIMWELVLFAPERQGVNAGNETIKTDLLKNKKFRDQIILRARLKLFFLADIVLAFVMGNENSLKVIINRAKEMTGKKLTPQKKKEYLEILAKQKELVKQHGAGRQISSLTNAIRVWNKSLSENKIRSIADTIKHHQVVGNLSK